MLPSHSPQLISQTTLITRCVASFTTEEVGIMSISILLINEMKFRGEAVYPNLH